MRILVVHPGASWSTADVYDGLTYGLRFHGAVVEQYRLDTRIEASVKSLHHLWRTKKKTEPGLTKPNKADVMYHAGIGALEMALRLQVDVVLVVSAMLLHPDVILMMKRAGLTVTVLFTETPYDIEKELVVAGMVDGCWTNERAAVYAFRQLNPHAGYLPHGWHPDKHFVAPDNPADEVMPAHDVVFIGSGFPERVTWFNSIDWTGIDLGLYGIWKGFGLKKQVQRCVKGDVVSNERAAALYRRAKIGLNIYRRYRGGLTPESLSPRAYEFAACGRFHLSEYRKEVVDVFGETVPTFTTPTEAAALIRFWLGQPERRQALAAQLPACVAEMSWVERAKTVLGDLQSLLGLTGDRNGSVSSSRSGDVSLHDRIRSGDVRSGDQRVDAQSDGGQDRSDLLRGRQQDLCVGAAGSAGDVLGRVG